MLIVDDDPDVREVLSTVLEAYGHEVSVAAGGVEALGVILERGRPSVALLDLRMPGMSGEELQDALLEAFAPDPIPVIVMSGEPRARDSVQRMQAVGFLPKPVALPVLLRALEPFASERDVTGA